MGCQGVPYFLEQEGWLRLPAAVQAFTAAGSHSHGNEHPLRLEATATVTSIHCGWKPLALGGRVMETDRVARLSFKPFDDSGVVRIYCNGFLPHWRQDGCTYFVTFRLADSIPAAVLRQWKYERGKWLLSRGIDALSDNWLRAFRQLSRDERQLFERHFVSLFFSKLDEGLGECVLRVPELAHQVSQALRHFHAQRLDIGDFVVMPNHVHALLTPYSGYELEQLLHSIKSYTANRIQRLRGTSGQLWMRESHDHIVRDGEELVRIQEYIRANPANVSLSDREFDLHTANYALG